MAAAAVANTRIETYTHKTCHWQSDTKSYGCAGMIPAGAIAMNLNSCEIKDARVRYCYFGTNTAHPIDVGDKKGLANFDTAVVGVGQVPINRATINPIQVGSILFYDANGGFLNEIKGSWKFEVKFFLQ